MAGHGAPYIRQGRARGRVPDFFQGQIFKLHHQRISVERLASIQPDHARSLGLGAVQQHIGTGHLKPVSGELHQALHAIRAVSSPARVAHSGFGCNLRRLRGSGKKNPPVHDARGVAAHAVPKPGPGPGQVNIRSLGPHNQARGSAECNHPLQPQPAARKVCFNTVQMHTAVRVRGPPGRAREMQIIIGQGHVRAVKRKRGAVRVVGLLADAAITGRGGPGHVRGRAAHGHVVPFAHGSGQARVRAPACAFGREPILHVKIQSRVQARAHIAAECLCGQGDTAGMVQIQRGIEIRNARVAHIQGGRGEIIAETHIGLFDLDFKPGEHWPFARGPGFGPRIIPLAPRVPVQENHRPGDLDGLHGLLGRGRVAKQAAPAQGHAHIAALEHGLIPRAKAQAPGPRTAPEVEPHCAQGHWLIQGILDRGFNPRLDARTRAVVQKHSTQPQRRRKHSRYHQRQQDQQRDFDSFPGRLFHPCCS